MSNFVVFRPSHSHHFNAYLQQEKKNDIGSILKRKQCGLRPLKDSNFWWFSSRGWRSEITASLGITCLSSEHFECREGPKGKSQVARSTA